MDLSSALHNHLGETSVDPCRGWVCIMIKSSDCWLICRLAGNQGIPDNLPDIFLECLLGTFLLNLSHLEKVHIV